VSDGGNRRQFSLNLVTNYLSSALSVVLGFIVPPLALSYWEVDRYGIWTLITSLVVYLSASSLGVETAAGVLMAKTPSATQKAGIFRSSTLILTSSCAISALFLFITNLLFPDWLTLFGRIPSSLAEESKAAIVAFVLAFLVNYPFTVVGAGMAGYQRQYIENIFRCASSLVGLASLAIVMSTGGGLVIYAFVQGGLNLLINFIRVFVFFFVVKTASLEEHVQGKDRSAKKESSPSFILSTGFRFFLFGISALLINNIDNFIISSMISVRSITSYSLSNKLLLVMANIATMFMASLAPIISKEYGHHNYAWLIRAYRTLTFTALFMGGGIWLLSSLFVEDFIVHVWVGANGSAGFFVIFLLGLYSFLATFVNINNIFLIQGNYTKGLVINGWAEVVVHIVIAVYLAPRFGVMGIAFGNSIATAITQFWMAPMHLKKSTDGVLTADWRGISRYLLFSLVPCILLGCVSRSFFTTPEARFLIGIVILLTYVGLSSIFLPREIANDLLSRLKCVIRKIFFTQRTFVE
jgi:O-antigen/teichoic acid export membrane protein